MKTIIKLIGLLATISALAGVAHARPSGTKPDVDPAYLVCTITLPDGNVIQGNGKNDLCLFYEGVEGVEIFYHMTSYPWSMVSLNTEEFLCELETGNLMQILKNIYRVDEYIVKVFGYVYATYGINTSPGISDQLLVKNTTVAQFEPMTIRFDSNFGEPTDIVVHLQGGRAPSHYNIQCKQIH